MSQYVTTSRGIAATYPTLSVFPASGTQGALAIDLSTDKLYAFETSDNSWHLMAGGGGGGGGTVTSVSVVTANGVSGVVASPTTTPAITLTLGAITPTSVAATGTVTGSNLSGTNTGDVTIGTANGLSLAGQVLSLALASTSTTGALSSTDWNTFNNKQSTLTLGNLTDAGTDGITITGGSGAVVGAGTSISQHVADSTHNGYLSSADWSTFNAKQAALTFGNLTGTGFTITGGTGAVIGSGTSIAMAAQNDMWVSRQGSDTTGDGSIANPFQTVGKALTLVASPSSTNNWTIHLLSGRHDQETNDLLMQPYVFIVGNGGCDVGSYLRLPAGKAIKLGAGFTANSRCGIQSVYLGGGTSVNLDYAAAGGSAGSNFMFDDVFVTGSFTHTGRGINGGDFLYIQNTYIFGNASLTGSELQSLNSTWGGNLVMATTASVNCDGTIIGGAVAGNFSLTQSGSATSNFQVAGTTFSGSFTTVGTVALTTDDNLPPGYSLSGGTTKTYTKDANSLHYIPGTSANWNSIPSLVTPALDTLASSGIVKSQSQNLVLASPNGSSGLPSFRALVAADLPGGTGTVTSVALTVPAFLSVSGSPITTSGTLAVSLSGSALPIANGGTNSTAALNSKRIMVSSGGSIVEAAALTNGQLLVGSTGNAPVAANITAGAGISITNGAGSITIATIAGANSYYVNLFTLSGADITNQFVTLSQAPDTAANTQLTVVGGLMQDYGVDFSVSGSVLSFSGDLATGGNAALVAGDKLIVQFN